jgi:hypothetical protein
MERLGGVLSYRTPVVADYGDLRAMTASHLLAAGIAGQSDANDLSFSGPPGPGGGDPGPGGGGDPGPGGGGDPGTGGGGSIPGTGGGGPSGGGVQGTHDSGGGPIAGPTGVGGDLPLTGRDFPVSSTPDASGVLGASGTEFGGDTPGVGGGAAGGTSAIGGGGESLPFTGAAAAAQAAAGGGLLAVGSVLRRLARRTKRESG